MKYLSTNEAATMAGVTPGAIMQARRAGTLKSAAQIGRAHGFTQAEVQRWMDWRAENPPESRRWGWNGGNPRPHGATPKTSEDNEGEE